MKLSVCLRQKLFLHVDNHLHFSLNNHDALFQIRNPKDDSDTYEDGKVSEMETAVEDSSHGNIPGPGISEEAENTSSSSNAVDPQPVSVGSYKRTLSGGLQSPRAEVPKKAILQRINSKKAKSYQLGHQLSRKWSTGAGPRIGCVADYPVELRLQALEMLNLSPKLPPSPSSYRLLGGLVSPTACSTPNGTKTETDENSRYSTPK